MLGENAPQDWGIADKTEWVSDKPLSREARFPALEGYDVIGFSESVDFAVGRMKTMPAHNGKPAHQVKRCPAGWYDNKGTCAQGKAPTQPTSPAQRMEQARKAGKWGGKTVGDDKPAPTQQKTPSSTSVDKPKQTKELTSKPSSKTTPEVPLEKEQKEALNKLEKQLIEGSSVESYKASDSFNKQTIKSLQEVIENPPNQLVSNPNAVDIKTELSNSNLFPNGVNFPPAYLDLLSQLGVTKAKGIDGPPLSDYIKGAGAGQPMSQVGELMTMISSSMSDEQANKFFEIMQRAANKGSVITPEWITAAKQNREAIGRAIKNNLGGGQVVASSWDVKPEVESLGLNYEDKGFSTDAFFRVKKEDGTEVILEVSLKKDKNVFFINGGAASLAEQSIMAMPDGSPTKEKLNTIDQKLKDLKDKYTQGANFRKDFPKILNKMSDEQKAEIRNAHAQYQELTSKRKNLLRENTSSYNSDVYMDGLTDDVYRPLAQRLLQDEDSLSEILNIAKTDNIDLNKYIKALKVNSLEEALTEIANTSAEDSGANHKKLLAKILTSKSLANSNNELLRSYADGLQTRYRKYQKGLADELSKDSPLRTAVISNIRKEFPLKAVMNGEEVMAIGDASFDLKTAEKVFGTTDIEKINQRLTIKTDKGGSPILVYSAGTENDEIPVATVLVRQRGVGYASMGFEAGLHPAFYDRLVQANIDQNLGGVKRVKYSKAEAKKGPRDDSKHIPENMTHSENKKPTFEDYMEILRAKKSSGGANYSDSMVFYKGKVLGRCPSGTVRAGRTCVPGAPSQKSAKAGYKSQDLGGLTRAQVKALSKAKSPEDIIEAHKKQNQND